jgi:hypothetical protein
MCVGGALLDARFTILVGVRFGCAALASGTMLLSRRQGGDGTRVFTVSSVLGPTEAQRCQAGPRPTLPLKGHSSEIPGRLPGAPPADSANRAERLLRAARQIAREHRVELEVLCSKPRCAPWFPVLELL